MNARDDVLERNLERLFARAWRPPRPRPEFRARLARELDERASRFGRSRVRVAPVWIAAAAALVVAALAWGLLGERARAVLPAADEILARGEVAWRAGGDGWNSAAPVDGVAELGPRAAPLEVRTPAQAGARLEWRGGALELEPAGALELERSGALWLAEGALVARAQAGELALAARPGALALESGRARLAHVEDGLAVRLEAGRGRLSDAPGERAVEAVGAWLLRDGRVVEPAAEPERRSVDADAPAQPRPDAPPAAEPSEVVLRGHVRAPDGFAEDGSPRWRAVADYRLLLLRAVALPMTAMPQEHAAREGDGGFAVPPLEPGEYTVYVVAPGFAVWRSEPVALGAAPGDPALVPVLDVRLDAGLTVRGSVRDESGAPLAGALVLSERDAAVNVLPLDAQSMGEFDYVRYALSGDDGSYALEHVGRGRQVLRASGGGAAVAWVDDLEVAGVAALAGVDFELSPAGAIEGRVLDADGAPRAGAIVLASVADFSRQRPALSYAACVVDAEGRYEIEGLPGGMLAVLLFAGGEPDAGEAPDMRLVPVREGARRTVDFLARREGASLAGRLLDESGAPLAGRPVWVESNAQGGRPEQLLSTTSDAEGRFAFAELGAGALDVYVAGMRPTELSLIERLTLERGDAFERDFRVGSERIAGRVLADADGAPVVGALVVLLEGPEQRFAGKSMSDVTGAFLLPHARPGLYDLWVVPARGQVGELERADLAVPAGLGVVDLELRLPPGGGIEARVRDEGGAPIAGAELAFVSPAGEPRWCEDEVASDASGRAAIEGLSIGRWRVRARAIGHAPAEVEVDVRATAFAPAELVLKRSP